MLLRVTQHENEKYFHAQFIAQFCWITELLWIVNNLLNFIWKKKHTSELKSKSSLLLSVVVGLNIIKFHFLLTSSLMSKKKKKQKQKRVAIEVKWKRRKKNGQLRFTFHYSLHFLFEFPHCLFFCCVFSSVCECGGHSKLTLKQKTCYEIIQHQNNIKYIKKIVRWLSERESYNYFSFIGAKIITFCIKFISKTQLKVWYWVHFQLLSSDNTHITQLQTFIFPAFPAWLSCKTERE